MELSKAQISTSVTIDKAHRIAYWDITKSVAIFCVVWGHCLQNMTTNTGYLWSDGLSQLIYSFHMPLFMVISGYFAFGSLSRPIGITLKKKILQLIVPSISWFIIISLLAMTLHRDFSVERLRHILFTLPHSFWFLKALFLCYIIALAGVWLMRWHKWSVLLFVMIIFCLGEVLNFSSTISMLPFFIAGLLLHIHEKKISSHQNWIVVCCLLIFTSMFILWEGNEYNIYQNPFKHSWGGIKYC